ncbi:MAG: hypothetical protein J7M08_10435 [Planctomycetes bacterium]|nr:hypothetical protein [Planctomycetota bacterium]
MSVREAVSFGGVILLCLALLGAAAQVSREEFEKLQKRVAELEKTTRTVTAERFELVDEKGNRRAVLGESEIGPGLELRDEKGNSRAVLGSTSLVVPKTGEITKLPESSLTLFDKDGKVIHEVP